MDIPEADLKKLLDTCKEAAHRGGKELVDRMGSARVSKKVRGDLVTEADFASQQKIRQLVEEVYPDHAFLGEEEDGSLKTLPDEGFCWIVDPLDGTMNYVHQLRSFSVSIGVAYNKQLIAGVVLDPLLNECYEGAIGMGAKLNGDSIHTSDCEDRNDALMVCSFSGKVGPDSVEVTRFLQVLEQAASVRRLGSAALNLCYIACGRLDGYWATSISLWDVAAGWVIAHEAGAFSSHLDGHPLDLKDPRFLTAANPKLHAELMPYMKVAQ